MNRHRHCALCKLDWCETCFIPESAPFVEHPHNLKKGLPLSVDNSWRCSHCRTLRRVTGPVYVFIITSIRSEILSLRRRRCDSCKYDLCNGCYARNTEAKAAQRPVHSHPLERGASVDSLLAIACSMCDVRHPSGAPIWRCEPCNWRACDHCYRPYPSEDIAAMASDLRAKFLFRYLLRTSVHAFCLYFALTSSQSQSCASANAIRGLSVG